MKSYQEIVEHVVWILERNNIAAQPGGVARQISDYAHSTQTEAYNEGVQKGDQVNPLTKLVNLP